MFNIYKLSYLLLLSVTLIGCDVSSDLLSEDVAFNVVDSDDRDMEVLIRRLHEYPVSVFSSIHFDKEKRELRFKRGAPDRKVIQFMAQNIGLFTIYGESEPEIKLSNKHVLRARPSKRDGKLFIQLQLNDEGGQVLKNITKVHLRKTIVVELDGVVMMKPTVLSELGKYFEMTYVGESSEASMTSVLIESGSLSRPITLQEIK